MFKIRTPLLFSMILFAVTLAAGLLFGPTPRLSSTARWVLPLWFSAFALNLVWLVLYLLVRRKKSGRGQGGWYLLGGGIFAIAAVLLLCLLTLSFGQR